MNHNIKTMKELLNYCIYCQICKNNSRIIDFNKNKNHLVQKSKDLSNISYETTLIDQKYSFNINFENDTFTVVYNSDKIPNSYALYLHAICKTCESYSLAEFSLYDKQIVDHQILKDNMIYIDNEFVYDLTLLYYSNSMLISKYNPDKDIFYDLKTIKLPDSMIRTDFSKKDMMINKINTILLFL